MFGILNSALRIATLSEQRSDCGQKAADRDHGAIHHSVPRPTTSRFHSRSAVEDWASKF